MHACLLQRLQVCCCFFCVWCPSRSPVASACHDSCMKTPHSHVSPPKMFFRPCVSQGCMEEQSEQSRVQSYAGGTVRSACSIGGPWSHSLFRNKSHVVSLIAKSCRLEAMMHLKRREAQDSMVQSEFVVVLLLLTRMSHWCL